MARRPGGKARRSGEQQQWARLDETRRVDTSEQRGCGRVPDRLYPTVCSRRAPSDRSVRGSVVVPQASALGLYLPVWIATMVGVWCGGSLESKSKSKSKSSQDPGCERARARQCRSSTSAVDGGLRGLVATAPAPWDGGMPPCRPIPRPGLLQGTVRAGHRCSQPAEDRWPFCAPGTRVVPQQRRRLPQPLHATLE